MNRITLAALGVAALGVTAAIVSVVYRKPPVIEIHIPLGEILDAALDEHYGEEDDEDELMPPDVFLGPVNLTDQDYKVLRRLDFDPSNDVD